MTARDDPRFQKIREGPSRDCRSTGIDYNQTKTMNTRTALAVIALLAAATFASAEDPAPLKPYPLEICFISGDKLGEMGKPIVLASEGQEIKLCCKQCKKKFDSDPAKYLKQLEKAAGGSAAASDSKE